MVKSDTSPVSLLGESRFRPLVALVIKLVACIKSIYTNKNIRLDNRGIGAWSRNYLSSLYITPLVVFVIVIALLVFDVPMRGAFKPGVILLALLPIASIKGLRWVNIGRVSSRFQLDNTSTKKQLRELESARKRFEGYLIVEFERAESAAEMNRETLNEILEMARNDLFDILAVWKLDRLTRADPWECMEYLMELKKLGIILYSENHGFFDWDDRHDFEIIIREVLFSREWYSRIKENAESGQLELLSQGKYPFGNPHFGYEKDSDDNLHLTVMGHQVIPEIFKTYLQEENRAEVRRRINRKYDFTDDNQLTDSQIRTVLESKLCIGQLTLKGEIVCTVPDLACISKQTFNQVQDILRHRAKSSKDSDVEVVPEPIERAHQRFGPEFISSIFSTLQERCPKCDDKLKETNGTVTIRNRILRKYRCDGCDYSGPLYSREQIDKLDSTIPLACPFCISVDQVRGKKTQSCVLEYLYTCKLCNNRFAVNVPPNTYRRAFERPELAFRWDPNQESESNEDDVDSPDVGFLWVQYPVSEPGGNHYTEDENSDDDDDEPATPVNRVD